MDGFRGLAAVMVVAFHSQFLSWGHWGVTLFFVISGYCILASADTCQKKNLGATNFFWKRFHRIYPPYLCALFFFIFTRLLKLHFTHENQLSQYSAIQFLQNATLTQWLTLAAHPNAGGNNPTLMVVAFWSLNYEVQFYAVVGIFLWLATRSKKTDMNRMILLLMATSLVWVSMLGSIRCGLFIEYWPVFALGCLVFMRLCKLENRWARLAVDGFLLVLTGVCAQARFRAAPVWVLGQATEPILVGAVFSLLLIAVRPASEWVAKTIFGRFIAFLGVISYSLYLIHQFNLNLAGSVIQHLLPARSPLVLVAMGVIGFQIALATLFWCICERPFLNEKIPLKPLFQFRKFVKKKNPGIMAVS